MTMRLRQKIVKKSMWYARHGKHKGMLELSIETNRELSKKAQKRAAQRAAGKFDSVQELFAANSRRR